MGAEVTRYRVLSATELVVARGLYRLPHVQLIDWNSRHSLVPVGSFILDNDLRACGWSKEPRPGLYLSLEDLRPLPRSIYCGCCGPDGDCKNILDPDTDEPIAYEFADCWNSHWARFESGEYHLVAESTGTISCFVGYVCYNDKRLLLGAACAEDEDESRKRLMTVCQNILKKEAGPKAQNQTILNLPVTMIEASAFLNYLNDKKPEWLFLQY